MANSIAQTPLPAKPAGSCITVSNANCVGYLYLSHQDRLFLRIWTGPNQLYCKALLMGTDAYAMHLLSKGVQQEQACLVRTPVSLKCKKDVDTVQEKWCTASLQVGVI
jgi:hypothetical protein